MAVPPNVYANEQPEEEVQRRRFFANVEKELCWRNSQQHLTTNFNSIQTFVEVNLTRLSWLEVGSITIACDFANEQPKEEVKRHQYFFFWQLWKKNFVEEIVNDI